MKSQLVCVRCGHSEDDHNWQTGPCNCKEGTSPFFPFYKTHCTCYAFVSPHSADGRIASAMVKAHGIDGALACGHVLNMSDEEKALRVEGYTSRGFMEAQ